MSAQDPFSAIANLDRLIHDPTRLAILTALSACEEADFLFLQRLIGLTKGNLSGHLSKLEQAGLVNIRKTFQGKRPITYLSLTPAGKEAIEAHWQALNRLQTEAANWQKDTE
jgi:DNA-binding MarR family transcriptional regulator